MVSLELGLTYLPSYRISLNWRNMQWNFIVRFSNTTSSFWNTDGEYKEEFINFKFVKYLGK